jgi:hypothetical protein
MFLPGEVLHLYNNWIKNHKLTSMQKSLTFFLAAILIAATFKASSQPPKSTWLTANAGLNSIWILNQNVYGNPEMDYGTKFGIMGTIGLNYYMDTKYGVSTGVGVGNFGQSYHGEQRGSNASRNVMLNYIIVPLFAMKQLGDLHNPFWLTFGPQLMILTSAKQKYSYDGDVNDLAYPANLKIGKFDVTKAYKPMDIMLNLGLTNLYFLQTGDNVRMMLSFNAALGLLDINSKEPQYRTVRTGQTYKGSHNFYLGAQIGLMFNP